MSAKKRLQVVVLQWEDAAGRADWDEDAPTPATMVANVCGFLIERSRTRVTVGLERFQGGRWRDVLTIPRSLVRHMEVLKTMEVDP